MKKPKGADRVSLTIMVMIDQEEKLLAADNVSLEGNQAELQAFSQTCGHVAESLAYGVFNDAFYPEGVADE